MIQSWALIHLNWQIDKWFLTWRPLNFCWVMFFFISMIKFSFELCNFIASSDTDHSFKWHQQRYKSGGMQWKSIRITPPPPSPDGTVHPTPHLLSMSWMNERVIVACQSRLCSNTFLFTTLLQHRELVRLQLKPVQHCVQPPVAAAEMKLLLLLLLMEHVAAQQRGERISVVSFDANWCKLLSSGGFNFKCYQHIMFLLFLSQDRYCGTIKGLNSFNCLSGSVNQVIDLMRWTWLVFNL